MTSYDVIYERFAQKITDYKLLELSDEDVETMLLSWLMSAIAKFRRCEHNLSQRDDELKKFEDDLNDTEIEILSLLMVNEWLEPQVNSVLYTSQFFGGKEEKSGYVLGSLYFEKNVVYSFIYAGKSLESQTKTEG